MAAAEPGSEGSSGEELPTLASLLQLPPSPPLSCAGLGRQPVSSPAPKAGSEVKVIVVSGSESEEEVEVVPLSERIRREVAFQPSQAGPGDAARGDAARGGGLRGGRELLAPGSRETSCGSQSDMDSVRGPSLCPLPASPPDSADQPGSRASPETSSPPKEPQCSVKKRKASCQAALQKRKEREAQRRQKEQEKEQKRALAKRLKALRPGECQKYMTVVVDEVLLQVEGGGQIFSALRAANYFCVVESQAVPCSITWRRKVVPSQMEEGDEWTEEPNVLVLLRLEEFLPMVRNYKQARLLEAQDFTEQKETLQSYVADVAEKMPGKILALAVADVEKYFRSLRFQSGKGLQRAAGSGDQEEQGKRRKKKVRDSGLELTRMDVEEALVDLQLSTQVPVRFFESWEELGEFVTMFTKAVAEAPFKREREKTGFPFYLEKRWCGGVRVKPSGEGLLEVWKRQIQQFNRVSREMAEAIVSAYPSPQLLIQ
ncbi:crossover junction endonuclease EME1 isoform X2 [Apus apus]|nr:crossover junction endonuclease EME1 isoform X2 [Apus apus]